MRAVAVAQQRNFFTRLGSKRVLKARLQTVALQTVAPSQKCQRQHSKKTSGAI